MQSAFIETGAFTIASPAFPAIECCVHNAANIKRVCTMIQQEIVKRRTLEQQRQLLLQSAPFDVFNTHSKEISKMHFSVYERFSETCGAPLAQIPNRNFVMVDDSIAAHFTQNKKHT